MKKKFICWSILTISVLLTGCNKHKYEKLDENKNNIDINSTTRYVNVSESVKVNSFNGYKLIDSDVIKNQNGTITVVLKFNQPIEKED